MSITNGPFSGTGERGVVEVEILGYDPLATPKISLYLSPEDVLREFHSKW